MSDFHHAEPDGDSVESVCTSPFSLRSTRSLALGAGWRVTDSNFFALPRGSVGVVAVGGANGGGDDFAPIVSAVVANAELPSSGMPACFSASSHRLAGPSDRISHAPSVGASHGSVGESHVITAHAPATSGRSSHSMSTARPEGAVSVSSRDHRLEGHLTPIPAIIHPAAGASAGDVPDGIRISPPHGQAAVESQKTDGADPGVNGTHTRAPDARVGTPGKSLLMTAPREYPTILRRAKATERSSKHPLRMLPSADTDTSVPSPAHGATPRNISFATCVGGPDDRHDPSQPIRHRDRGGGTDTDDGGSDESHSPRPSFTTERVSLAGSIAADSAFDDSLPAFRLGQAGESRGSMHIRSPNQSVNAHSFSRLSSAVTEGASLASLSVSTGQVSSPAPPAGLGSWRVAGPGAFGGRGRGRAGSIREPHVASTREPHVVTAGPAAAGPTDPLPEASARLVTFLAPPRTRCTPQNGPPSSGALDGTHDSIRDGLSHSSATPDPRSPLLTPAASSELNVSVPPIPTSAAVAVTMRKVGTTGGI
eukprot:TRINITY_DN10565_c0_g1_i1.p1 TRINITY_DN10565_c0_g1~~TRINITY_DN10565_c0_g1_i1.p1  ORF type:complete len:538 (+),score=46.26 TRINITY_DN10565_c0_g1_i1:259-1872(+)